jgi:hypothetical protein
MVFLLFFKHSLYAKVDYIKEDDWIATTPERRFAMTISYCDTVSTARNDKAKKDEKRHRRHSMTGCRKTFICGAGHHFFVLSLMKQRGSSAR